MPSAIINQQLEHLARPIAELRQDPSNARAHSKRNVEAIAASLRRFGQLKPVVVKDGVVIAGNGTLEAALSLGWERLAAVDFSSEQPGAYAIADNRTAELASWSFDKLLEATSAVSDELLHSIGFADDELAALRAPGRAAEPGA